MGGAAETTAAGVYAADGHENDQEGDDREEDGGDSLALRKTGRLRGWEGVGLCGCGRDGVHVDGCLWVLREGRRDGIGR